jgi:hypothetical protein
MVDANYTESGSTEYMGKVLYAEDDEHAEEDGNVEIDTSADEVMPDVVDTMLELESEFSRGK